MRLEKSPANAGIHACREVTEGVITVFLGEKGKRPALEVGTWSCPTGVGRFPVTNNFSLLLRGFVLRVAKKMADALPTAQERDRKHSGQASIARYRVNASARNAPASRPRIAEMIMLHSPVLRFQHAPDKRQRLQLHQPAYLCASQIQ